MKRVDSIHDVNEPEMEGPYWKRRRKVRERSRVVWRMFLAGVFVSAALAAWLFPKPEDMTDPLLKGPPQFILLAIVVALAAYLRLVSAGASELRNKLSKGNEVWNYPYAKPYTKEKVDLLDDIGDNLSIAAGFTIWLFVVIASRILADSALRFYSQQVQRFKLLFVFDFIIAEWLFAMFLALAITHFRSRDRDNTIRAISLDWEDEHRPKQVDEAKREARYETANPGSHAERGSRPRSERFSYLSIGIAALLMGLFGGFKEERRN